MSIKFVNDFSLECYKLESKNYQYTHDAPTTFLATVLKYQFGQFVYIGEPLVIIARGSTMSDQGYCPECRKNVNGTTDINWVIFIILLLLGILLGLIYLVYCLTKPKICPFCKNTLDPFRSESNVSNQKSPQSVCLGCGSFLYGERFCSVCGKPNPNADSVGNAVPPHSQNISFEFSAPAVTDNKKRVINCYLALDGDKIATANGSMSRSISTTNGEHTLKFFANMGSSMYNQTARIEESIDIVDGMRIRIEYTDNKPSFHTEVLEYPR